MFSSKPKGSSFQFFSNANELRCIIASTIYGKTVFSQVSNATLVFKIGSLKTEITTLVSRMPLLRDKFQEKVTFWFGMLDGQLSGQIFYSFFFSGMI